MAPDPLEIQVLAGPAAHHLEDGFSRLRLSVFREFPYLYAGRLVDERRHFASYTTPQATVVAALRRGQLVGIATALPATAAGEEVQRPLRDAGMNPRDIYYFAEAVIRKRYRGRGIGRQFNAAREDRARHLGFELAALCAVERKAAHPLRPPGYRPPDRFWSAQGFIRRSDLQTWFAWRDVGETLETPKRMVFWVKKLRAAG